MQSKTSIYLLISLFLVSCNNSKSKTSIEIEEDFSSLPQLNSNKNKAIDILISKCNFEKLYPKCGTAIYKSSLEDGTLKLVMGSLLSCDYKNGAYVKPLISNSDTLKFDIYSNGTSLSNECECFFYYELTLKNLKSIPKNILLGNDECIDDFRSTISQSTINIINNKLNN